VLSGFVLIGNPLIVMAIMGYMGYRKRTGFLAGLTVAQISEFSIVFVAMGITLGHVGIDVLGLTTLVGVVTITLSTYMILYSQPLYTRLAGMLAPFERRHPYRELAVEQNGHGSEHPDVVVFGLGRYGSRLANGLKDNGFAVLGVDFDPELVQALGGKDLSVRFGDGQDPAFLDSLPLDGVRWAISTLPDLDSNHALLYGLTERSFSGEIAIVARDEAQGAALWRLGTPFVLYPFRDAVDFTVEQLTGLMRPAKGAS
jgi:hypothetical protein